ncbi:MAG: hypothetical protein ACOX6E_00460 [Syntrophomonadaceae bacterium]
MQCFYNLTSVNGFDTENLNNGRQNNYAWSMTELGDYIYVGTGRNILVNIITAIYANTNIPALINPTPDVDNEAEIWRYRKDGALPWQKVYPTDLVQSNLFGFRFMINHRPFGGNPCIYAAGYGNDVQILKTTNGVDWFILDSSSGLQGSSSRAMVSHNGKIYLSTVNALNQSSGPLLYSSPDPEFYPWELLIDPSKPGFDPDKNPQNAISNMAVFNNRLYVATSSPNGVQVWRTNGEEPQMNEWTRVVNSGFGNPANWFTLGIGVFKNHLYVSATKPLPLAWFIPMGCDIIRIDKNDNWQLVVGGNPLISLNSSVDENYRSLTGLGSGFNNPFNVYGWQIQEFKGKLLVSTFDDSSNMEVILTTLLANRQLLEQRFNPTIISLIIEVYRAVVGILRTIRYPIGFDLYISEDGTRFSPVFLNGLGNPNNYGGRILFVDSDNKLYIGTANPFQGCEVWRASTIPYRGWKKHDHNYYRCLLQIKEILSEKYDILSENMPTILQYINNNSI